MYSERILFRALCLHIINSTHLHVCFLACRVLRVDWPPRVPGEGVVWSCVEWAEGKDGRAGKEHAGSAEQCSQRTRWSHITQTQHGVSQVHHAPCTSSSSTPCCIMWYKNYLFWNVLYSSDPSSGKPAKSVSFRVIVFFCNKSFFMQNQHKL